MPRTKLSKTLIIARQHLGLTLYQAAERMPHTSYQTLWHLEGNAKGRKPAAGENIALKTAADIVRTYWPAIQMDDLMPECRTLRFERVEHRA